MSDRHLIDLGEIRNGLAAVEGMLTDAMDGSHESVDAALVRGLLEAATPRLDPEASIPSARSEVIDRAMRAAVDVLNAELRDPAVIMIVQEHDQSGRNVSRTLATTAMNPQDILRTVLRNITEKAQAPQARRRL